MFLGANRLGKMFSGMGGLGRGVYNAGKYGMDKALANKLATAGIVAGGYAAYSGTRGHSMVRAAGVGGLGYAAYRGALGSTAQSYMGAGVNTAMGVARMGLSRMRRF